MKVALKITTLALACVSNSVYAHELRGPAVNLADVAATDSKATSSSGDFFPPEEEMDGEDEGKRNSAQKRQDQRDARRYRNNPNRSQAEEDRERERKYKQSKSRGRDQVDPYDPNHGSRDYARDRETGRSSQCRRNGRGCNYHRDRTNEPNPRRRQADRDCYRGCNGRRSCERRCDSLEDVEDVEYIADFLSYEDVDFIADFLRDAFDEAEDSSGDY